MIKAFKRFRRDEKGSFSMMAAGAIIPLTLAIVGGIDYAEHIKIRKNVQHSADTAVLAAFNKGSRNWSKRQQTARKYFKANLAYRKKLGSVKTKLSRGRGYQKEIMTYTVRTQVKSLFGNLSPLGSTSMTVTATAEKHMFNNHPARIVASPSSGVSDRKRK